ncbi:competence protein CoiA family protein [Robertmurraya massiliosenegalensis]|uniref:competence protein CoiA n=1 Tax=Robertmurraya TaxID=2837507 RepID=UPI0039A4A97D
MLTAKLQSGEVISLAEKKNKLFLQKLREKEVFYCRTCDEEVILRLGEKRIYHFAHLKDSSCTEEYERESDYHMAGKLKLYEWIMKQGLSVELERYFPEIKQRADIAFEYEKQQYCIEFQCSTISDEVFRKRTKGYQKIAIEPIWILGGKNIQRKHRDKVSLTAFHYLFLNENSRKQSYLPAYCPQSNQYIQLDNLYNLSMRKAFCHFSINPLQKMNISDLLKPTIPKFTPIHDWTIELYRFKLTLLGNSPNSHFLTELYSNSINPYYLPPYVGIPLIGSCAIETPPFIWQTYIFIKHLHGQERGTQIYFHDIYTTILKRLREGHIKARSLPAISRNMLPFAIEEYLEQLSMNGVLKKVKNHHYKIDKSMKIANNMEEWVQEEKKFYQQFHLNRKPSSNLKH